MKHYYFKSQYHSYIYDIVIEQLLSYNPPCKDCLVQPMCIYCNSCMSDKLRSKVITKSCKMLDKFMKGNSKFINIDGYNKI